ncbi:hypothetical protein B0H34DRAFT_69028 [Crassisporium funariophilum]|nr:hypothetical protein B0H34DRAFT_69028 [Crassisporium funariophilum]
MRDLPFLVSFLVFSRSVIHHSPYPCTHGHTPRDAPFLYSTWPPTKLPHAHILTPQDCFPLDHSVLQQTPSPLRLHVSCLTHFSPTSILCRHILSHDNWPFFRLIISSSSLAIGSSRALHSSRFFYYTNDGSCCFSIFLFTPSLLSPWKISISVLVYYWPPALFASVFILAPSLFSVHPTAGMEDYRAHNGLLYYFWNSPMILLDATCLPRLEMYFHEICMYDGSWYCGNVRQYILGQDEFSCDGCDSREDKSSCPGERSGLGV